MGPAKKPRTRALALVVDDEPRVRKMVSDLLEEAGCACLEAQDAEEAMRLLEEHQPQLGVLDINLPGMSGAELAWRIRERCPGMKLVALSGYLKDWDREDLTDLGFDRIFQKPMDCGAFTEYCRAISAANTRRPRRSRGAGDDQ